MELFWNEIYFFGTEINEQECSWSVPTRNVPLHSQDHIHPCTTKFDSKFCGLPTKLQQRGPLVVVVGVLKLPFRACPRVNMAGKHQVGSLGHWFAYGETFSNHQFIKLQNSGSMEIIDV